MKENEKIACFIRKFEYKTWIYSLKSRIKASQIKASVAVNEEMLCLYWNIGKDISENQFEAAYGSKFFENLSFDLKNSFPTIQGFSATNLKYMKRFYLFYKEIRVTSLVTNLKASFYNSMAASYRNFYPFTFC